MGQVDDHLIELHKALDTSHAVFVELASRLETISREESTVEVNSEPTKAKESPLVPLAFRIRELTELSQLLNQKITLTIDGLEL